MKKITIFLIIFCFLFMSTPSPVFADEEKYYAKIQSTGVMFYQEKNSDSPLFEIPYSYFVKVNSADGDYFSASYKNLNGFVKKSEVKLMKGSPKQPYAESTFSVYTDFSLYQKPSKASVLQADINESSTITYYGKISGQALSSASSEWLYGSITQNSTEIFGYVYSTLVNILPSPPANSEIYQIVDEKVLTNSSSTEFSSLSKGTKILLIVSISLPSLLILYFLIKPARLTQITKTRKQLKKESKRVKHGDYFEFDESQL